MTYLVVKYSRKISEMALENLPHLSSLGKTNLSLVLSILKSCIFLVEEYLLHQTRKKESSCRRHDTHKRTNHLMQEY